MIEFAFRVGAGPLVRMASFSQTGGRRYGTAFGSQYYAFTWHAEIEFADHALWCYPFTVRPYNRRELALLHGAQEVQLGDHGSVDGDITLIYNAANGYHVGKGWQLQKTTYSDTSRLCR